MPTLSGPYSVDVMAALSDNGGWWAVALTHPLSLV
jgi:hypothetical protein